MSVNIPTLPDEENDNGPVSNNGTLDFSGETPISERITELEAALSKTTEQLNKLCNNNSWQVGFLIAINVIFLFLVILFGIVLYSFKDFTPTWTWQLIYFTATRLVLVSGIATIFIFSLNLLKTYLINYKINREKLFVLKSMASLIEAGSFYSEREKIYHKLLDIVLSPTPNEIGDSQKDMIKLEALNPIVELIKEAIKKQ